jgi:protein-S-isoprenylcysteine O-methyltransferase Ste14
MSTKIQSAVGGWAFRRRTWLPLLFAPLLFFPGATRHVIVIEIGLGLPLLLLGESLRLVSVGFAGRVTRTRTGQLGPLVVTGPYRFLRNPLYVGNLLILAGGLILCGRFPLVPVFVPIAALYYQQIVRWEESYLQSVFQREYDEYCRSVPRWIPRLMPARKGSLHAFDGLEALQSERGTFGTLLVVFVVAEVLQLMRI